MVYEEYIKAIDNRNIEIPEDVYKYHHSIVLGWIDKLPKDKVIEKIDRIIVNLKEEISVTKFTLDKNMLKGRKAKLKRSLERLNKEAAELNMKLRKLEAEYAAYKEIKKSIEENDVYKNKKDE